MEQDAQPEWIRDLGDKEAKLAALRDVRAERALEIQILQSREQWFWVPWTVCLAAGLSSQYSPSPIVRIGVAVICCVLANVLAYLRWVGLKTTLAALDIRQAKVLALTYRDKRLEHVGFDERGVSFEEHSHGTKAYHDRDHERGFRYPLRVIALTPFLWIAIILLAVASTFWKVKW
jgi:hypothetical protein